MDQLPSKQFLSRLADNLDDPKSNSKLRQDPESHAHHHEALSHLHQKRQNSKDSPTVLRLSRAKWELLQEVY